MKNRYLAAILFLAVQTVQADFTNPGFEVPSATDWKPAYWRFVGTTTNLGSMSYPIRTHCVWIAGAGTKPYQQCKKSVQLSRTVTDPENWIGILPAIKKRVSVIPGHRYCYSTQYAATAAYPIVFISYSVLGTVVETFNSNTYTTLGIQWHDSGLICHYAPNNAALMDALIKVDKPGTIFIEHQHLNEY